MAIPPGGVYADTLHVDGSEAGGRVWPVFPTRDLNGVYRLVWDRLLLRFDVRAPGVPVPLRYRVSNRFRLVQAR